VLVLTPYLYGTAGGPRSSIELWERVLEPRGISFEYAPFESQRLNEILYQQGHSVEKVKEMVRSYARRIADLRRVSDFDAVLIYREAALIGPAVIERLVARRRPILYQLDDPLYVPYRAPTNGYLSHLKVFGKVGSIARRSRVVVVNSPQHLEYATRFAADVRTVPSVVDADVYTYRPKEEVEGPVTIGWSGSVSTAPNLRVIRPALEELGKRDDVRLHFIGAQSFDLPEVRHTSQAWSAETEVEDLRRFDIGLLPLPVDEWTKRKFYLKLVQYMALGIPAVCTPLGANPEVVEDGVTGFLASTQDEWLTAIDRLVTNPALRRAMGARAAEVAADRYTVQANAKVIEGAFRALVA
jgi:glycosyltransferase involved in cell wall biosynthesis